MEAVLRLQKKWKVKGDIKPSTRKNKKHMITRPDGSVVHFGDSRYEDFTTHKDKNRQQNYCRRAGAIKNKNGQLTGNDPSSANFYAMRLLWDCTPS